MKLNELPLNKKNIVITRSLDSISEVKNLFQEKGANVLITGRSEARLQTAKLYTNAEILEFDISDFEIVNEPDENRTAKIAAKLASEEKIKIIVKGHIHTDVLMKAVLKREFNLIGKKRLRHGWPMTLYKNAKPLIGREFAAAI